MAQTKIQISSGEKVLNIINIVIVTFFLLCCIYPFYYILIGSISSPSAVSEGLSFLPRQITFSTFGKLFEKGDIGNAFFISIARTVLGTVICVLASSFFAYLVTKQEMIGRKFVFRFVIVTMYFNAGLIPWYITMKTFGLKNSFLLYIIPGAVQAFYIILVKTFIEELPASMEESASLDGAGFFMIFFKIILPLSKPIIATIAVYCAVGQWNTWTDNYFLVTNPRLQTLQVILYKYLTAAENIARSMSSGMGVNMANMSNAITPTSVQMCITVVTVLPIMLVYPFLQKQFAKGIMMGAVKG